MEPKKAIVFVHGFLGSNRQFDGIKRELEGCGADFVDHLVAGHGGSVREFAKSSDYSWQRGLNEHIGRLEGEYGELCIVGHSMGGLLALRAAVAAPEKLRGVVVIGFPARVRLTRKWLDMMRLASSPEVEGEDPRVTAARNLGGVEIKSIGALLRTAPNSLRFLRLAKRARGELRLLKAPLAVINAEFDEIVSPSVAGLVRKELPSARILTMPGAYHFLFGAENERMIAEEILRTCSQWRE